RPDGREKDHSYRKRDDLAAYQKHQKSATSPTISGSFQYFKTDGNPLIEGVERFFSADSLSVLPRIEFCDLVLPRSSH
ncbi:hypothetical protein, partial [Sinorhizobium meliloti]|uniref:hypothetical protein n=1 Tax=Rhizobium meliloti TaxID=382 RepID=UPI001AEBAAAF